MSVKATGDVVHHVVLPGILLPLVDLCVGGGAVYRSCEGCLVTTAPEGCGAPSWAPSGLYWARFSSAILSGTWGVRPTSVHQHRKWNPPLLPVPELVALGCEGGCHGMGTQANEGSLLRAQRRLWPVLVLNADHIRHLKWG